MAKGMSGLKGHTPKATHINNSGSSAKWVNAKNMGQVTINSGAVNGSAPAKSGKGKAPRSKTAC